jgi:hypothetical protein
MDDGASGSFTAIVGYLSPYTLNYYIDTTSITSGATYNVKYRAYNIFGWGDYSPITQIIAYSIPGVPGIPATTLSGTNVVISWSAPSSNGGTGISLSSYTVEVLQSNGVTFTSVTCTETSSVVVSGT